MKCQFIKENKDNCRANAISTDKFCFSHSPQTAQAKQEAVRNGGRSPKARQEKTLPPIGIHTNKGILFLLYETVNRLRDGKMTPQKANSIERLASLNFQILNEGKMRKEVISLADIIKGEITDPKLIEEFFGDAMPKSDWRDVYSVEEKHKGKPYNLFTAPPVQ